MHSRAIALALVFCGSACAGDDADLGDTGTGSDGARGDLRHPLASPAEGDDICFVLPADGPCALLCDRDALVDAYVPWGTCAVFGCTLTNGREVAAHFCNP